MGVSGLGALATRTRGSELRLSRLTHKKGEISSALAWGDLAHMKLEAGKVVEARCKEVEYTPDKRVYDKIPRAQA